jgi:purine-binding chemotaxis protein CheW
MDDIIIEQKKIISYLTFNLGEELFALNVSSVINILEMQNITKVPQSPDFMIGIINLRGEVLPVIDTNIKLGMGFTKTTTDTCILVIESKLSDSTIRFGVLVDAVQEVSEFDDEKILPSPSIGNKYHAELICGVVEQLDKFIMILDINKLLDAKEALNLKEISKSLK